MTDDPIFLQSITEAPDDLGPRLRYADFLDDQGNAAAATRAEFIRVQCALADLPETDQSLDQLRRRERELLEANWHVWMRPICQALGEPLPVPPVKRTWGDWMRRRLRRGSLELQPTPRFRLFWFDSPRYHIITRPPIGAESNDFLIYTAFSRGFIEDVALYNRGSRGPSHFDRLFERAPVISLVLHNFDAPHLMHLIDNGLLRRLRRLELLDLNLERLAPLISTTEAASIRSLGLSFDGLGDVDVVEISGSRSLQPEKLGLHHFRIPDESAAALATSNMMANVRHLALDFVDIGERGLTQLLQNSTIEHLDMFGSTALAFEREFGQALRERFPHINISARGHVRT